MTVYLLQSVINHEMVILRFGSLSLSLLMASVVFGGCFDLFFCCCFKWISFSFEVDVYLPFEEFDSDDGPRAEFPCPFCWEDFDIIGLCCHIDEEHPVESKNGVFFCSVCWRWIIILLVSFNYQSEGFQNLSICFLKEICGSSGLIFMSILGFYTNFGQTCSLKSTMLIVWRKIDLSRLFEYSIFHV